MPKIYRDASPVIPAQSSRTPPPASGPEKSAPVVPDGFAANPAAAPPSLSDETKMDIVCPLMGALVNQGHVKLDEKGRMKTRDFEAAIRKNLNVTRTVGVGALLAAPFANKPADVLKNLLGMSFNPLKLRSGMIKHPNGSMILDAGRFDEARFQALTAHAKNGRMTIASYGAAIAERIGRDGTKSGVNLALAEAAAVLNFFGEVDPRTGERSVDLTTLRNLYQHQQLPPSGLMMSRPKTGLGDLRGTIARLTHAMPMGSAAGNAAEGLNRSLGESNSLGADAKVGAGKASCPHMQGNGARPPPSGADQIAALHDRQ